MKSLSCQLHREAFLKSFTIVSRVKLISRSDPPRKVGLSCSARATLAFNFNRGFDSFTRFAAARSEAEETIPKRPKCLLAAFNGTDAGVPDAAAAAVSAIVEMQERAAPSAAEAAAVLAGFKRDSEHADALHKSNPGAGEGNSRLVIDITYPLGTSSGFPLPRRVRRADGASLRLVRAARIQVGLGESGKHFHYSASQSICQSIIGPGPSRWKREF